MSSNPHSTHTLAKLGQWHSGSTSRNRPSSSSSHSSTDPSRPVTPQDSVFPHLHPQISRRPAVPSTYPINDPCNQKHLQIPSVSSLEREPYSDLEEDEDIAERSRLRTQTVTPATVRRAREYDQFDQMRLPFPGSNQRDSVSSTESRPSNSSLDTASVYDEELGGIPARHPLRNRVNSKSSSLLTEDDGKPGSPPKPRTRPQNGRPDSTASSCTQSSYSSTSSLSLRLKPKKSHSQRGTMNLFKSLGSSPHPTPAIELADIEFDWAERRKQDLEIRSRLLEQKYEEEREIMLVQATSDSDEAQAPVTLRPRSWELTPEGLQLRHEQEEEEWRKFTFRDRIYVNRSYVSPYAKDAVPYPLGYDKVTLQTDRHSHDLLRQLFTGRPSIHDDVSQKAPVTVLDLGCGDGTWIIEAAHCWRNTLFYGLDLQSLHPSRAQLIAEFGEQAADNIRFTYYNFLLDKLPYLDDKFDLVRMANLKWAIPEDQWDFVLQEVQRVLKRGGWVEIIDDEFLPATSLNHTLSTEQHATCEILEAQFEGMLRDRNLPLNMRRDFMNEKLGRHFNAFHEDDFAMTISKARPLSIDMHGQVPIQVIIPSEGMSHKAAKLMGLGGHDDKHRSFGSSKSSRSRSRSASVSSAASHSTRGDEIKIEQVEEPDQDIDEPAGSVSAFSKPPVYQPLGLEVHPGRFMPFPPTELSAHATRNMQSILASKEAIRAHELKKDPELRELEIKDDLLPEEKQRFDQLAWGWNRQWRAFDDIFWDYETAMLKRLGLPQRFFDFDDDEEHHKSTNGMRASALGKLHRGSDANLSSPVTSTFAAGSTVAVRLIRVYSGWK